MFKKLSVFIFLCGTAFGFQIDPPSPKLHLSPPLEKLFWEQWSSCPGELTFSLFTIPKSGSHLVIKLLYLLTGAFPEWHMSYPIMQSHRLVYPYTHLCLSQELQAAYTIHALGRRKIVHIRDLRDVCVSIVYHILKTGEWPELGDQRRLAAFRQLSFDDQLLFVIQQDYDVIDKRMIQLSISRVARQAVEYLNDPHTLITRYENLVGPEGGGTREAQLAEIEKVETYIGRPINRNFIELVASLLYGDNIDPFNGPGFSTYHSTFRRGGIGTWKEAFKPQHKAAFKKKMGGALVALGYERDNDW